MVLDLSTAYTINLLILASFLVADLVVLLRSPTRTYFVYWVWSLGLWVVNLTLIVLFRNHPISFWLSTILATGSHSLVLASAGRLGGKVRNTAPVLLFVLGVLAATLTVFTGQSFWVRRLVVGPFSPIAYCLAAVAILRKAPSGLDRRSPTGRIDALIAGSLLLCGLAWTVRLIAFILEGNAPSTGLYDVSVPNVVAAVMILPITVLINSFFILRESRDQIEQRREAESRVLVDQNEYLRNRLDSEMSSKVLTELVSAEESFRRCLLPGKQFDSAEYENLRSRIARCTEDVRLRNEMLRELVDYEERIEASPFFERVNKLLGMSDLPPFHFETAGVPDGLVLSKSYVFWICYVIGTMAGSAAVHVTISAKPDANALALRFVLDREANIPPIPSLSDKETDKLIESGDTALERPFVLASFVHSHFGGRIETHSSPEADSPSHLAIEVTFESSRQ